MDFEDLTESLQELMSLGASPASPEEEAVAQVEEHVVDEKESLVQSSPVDVTTDTVVEEAVDETAKEAVDETAKEAVYETAKEAESELAVKEQTVEVKEKTVEVKEQTGNDDVNSASRNVPESLVVQPPTGSLTELIGEQQDAASSGLASSSGAGSPMTSPMTSPTGGLVMGPLFPPTSPRDSLECPGSSGSESSPEGTPARKLSSSLPVVDETSKRRRALEAQESLRNLSSMGTIKGALNASLTDLRETAGNDEDDGDAQRLADIVARRGRRASSVDAAGVIDSAHKAEDAAPLASDRSPRTGSRRKHRSRRDESLTLRVHDRGSGSKSFLGGLRRTFRGANTGAPQGKDVVIGGPQYDSFKKVTETRQYMQALDGVSPEQEEQYRRMLESHVRRERESAGDAAASASASADTPTPARPPVDLSAVERIQQAQEQWGELKKTLAQQEAPARRKKNSKKGMDEFHAVPVPVSAAAPAAIPVSMLMMSGGMTASGGVVTASGAQAASLMTSGGAADAVDSQVSAVLNELGLARFAPRFAEQEIDYEGFLLLREDDVLNLMQIPVGPARKLLNRISSLNADAREVFSSSSSTSAAGPLGDSRWEINVADLRMVRKLGEGSFGEVWYAKWRNSPVAVKKLFHQGMSDAQVVEFRKEADIFMQLRPHKNVIQFLGVSTTPPNLCMVTEFVPKGDLHGILQKGTLSLERKIKIAIGAAAGMSHLHHEDILHCDLAARNLLITADYDVKVADFGLSKRGSKYESTSGFGPLKWMSPEALEPSRKLFTRKNDVWAFGVVLWEMFTDGQEPFPDMQSYQAALAVMGGTRLDVPPSAPPAVASIMRSCWKTDHDERPEFDTLVDLLETAFLDATGQDVSRMHSATMTTLTAGIDLHKMMAEAAAADAASDASKDSQSPRPKNDTYMAVGSVLAKPDATDGSDDDRPDDPSQQRAGDAGTMTAADITNVLSLIPPTHPKK